MNETVSAALRRAIISKREQLSHAEALLAAANEQSDERANVRRHLFDKTCRLEREIGELQASLAERNHLSLTGDASPRP